MALQQHFRTVDAAKGLTDTKKAYDLDPNNVANYYNMAMVYKL